MSPCYQEDLKRLESFRELKDNWDSYGAKPLDAATLTWAKSALDRIHKAELPLKHFCPCCTGAIEFEFGLVNLWAALLVMADRLEVVTGYYGDETHEATLDESIGELVAFFKQEAKKL